MAPRCTTCCRRVHSGRLTKQRSTQCWHCRQGRPVLESQRPVSVVSESALIEAQIAQHLAVIRRERRFSVETRWSSPLARIA